MQAIERQVCGCDFGGNSWTTQDQADSLIPILRLDSSTKLIDLGAGTGWPGLYLSQKTGCAVTLVDLPEIGLKIAKQRAEADGISKRVSTVVADAADLPFPNESFDAISHSDLLCCLVRKRAVLEQCRTIVCTGGRMAFTVISLAPGLSQSARTRALENAPDFIAAETPYRVLLRETGWDVIDWTNLTSEYRESCARQIDADCENRAELEDLFGEIAAKERLANWRSKLHAIEDGLFVRELFVCEARNQVIA